MVHPSLIGVAPSRSRLIDDRVRCCALLVKTGQSSPLQQDRRNCTKRNAPQLGLVSIEKRTGEQLRTPHFVREFGAKRKAFVSVW